MCQRALPGSLPGSRGRLWMLIFALCKARVQREQSISSRYGAVGVRVPVTAFTPCCSPAASQLLALELAADIRVWKALKI